MSEDAPAHTSRNAPDPAAAPTPAGAVGALPAVEAVVAPLREALAAKGYALTHLAVTYYLGGDTPDQWDIELLWDDGMWMRNCDATANTVADLLAHIEALPHNPAGTAVRP